VVGTRSPRTNRIVAGGAHGRETSLVRPLCVLLVELDGEFGGRGLPLAHRAAFLEWIVRRAARLDILVSGVDAPPVVVIIIIIIIRLDEPTVAKMRLLRGRGSVSRCQPPISNSGGGGAAKPHSHQLRRRAHRNRAVGRRQVLQYDERARDERRVEFLETPASRGGMMRPRPAQPSLPRNAPLPPRRGEEAVPAVLSMDVP